jgi:hypothetical protein
VHTTRKDNDVMSSASVSARAPAARRFLTRRGQADRYAKSLKTIERWGKNQHMKMPPEYDFNGLPHRDEAELEAWERTRVASKD